MAEFSEVEIRKAIDGIIAGHKVLALSFSDQHGPWTSPVYYSGDINSLTFLSSPDTRHGRAIKENLSFAAAIYGEPENWQEIKGLQISGRVEIPEDEALARASFLKKFPFASLLLAKTRLLDPLIKAKTEKISFYNLVPAEVILVDNSFKFGFHHKIIL